MHSVMCSYPHATKFILTAGFVSFSEAHHSLDLYKRMTAFVMAYSFTKNSSDEKDDSDSENAALTRSYHLCPEMHAMTKIWRKSSTIDNVSKISDFCDLLPISSN